MLLKDDDGWYICYSNGQVFGGPHETMAAAQAAYDALSKFDQMIVSGRPPGCMTDSVFMEGVVCGNQFEKRPEIGDFYRQECERHGGSTTGKKYLSQLARFPGDPRAWVSGRGDVQKVCEANGMGCDGAVKVKRAETDGPAKPIDVAPDVLEKYTDKEVARQGGRVSPKKRQKIKEDVRNRIVPSWKR